MTFRAALLTALAMLCLPAAAPAEAPADANATSVRPILCTGITPADTLEMSKAVAAAVANTEHGTLVEVHGRHCSFGAAFTGAFTTNFGIRGDGAGSTIFTWVNATDGFNFTFSHPGNGLVPPTFHGQGFSIVRGQTTPAAANTALTITAVNTAGVYQSAALLRDVTIRGAWGPGSHFNPSAQWKYGLVANNLAFTLDNVQIYGLGGGPTDAGDRLVVINGPTTGAGHAYVAGVNIINTLLQGGSVGILVNGYVQGVNVTNQGPLGDYDGIDWFGASPPFSHKTTNGTASGQLLQFAPGSVGDILVSDIVNGSGTNINPQSLVTEVNNATGVVKLNLGIKSPVASGEAIAFQHMYGAEGLVLSNVGLQAQHRGVFCQWCSVSSITGTSIFHFGRTPVSPYWAAIQFDEGNNNIIYDNQVVASGQGTEYAVALTSQGLKGTNSPNLIQGNIAISVTSCFYLQGTTARTTVTGNNCSARESIVKATLPDANQILMNFNDNGSPPDMTENPVTGQLVFSGLPRFNNGYQVPLRTPPSSSAPCVTGQQAADANYVYVCVATNTWKRSPLSPF